MLFNTFCPSGICKWSFCNQVADLIVNSPRLTPIELCTCCKGREMLQILFTILCSRTLANLSFTQFFPSMKSLIHFQVPIQILPINFGIRWKKRKRKSSHGSKKGYLYHLPLSTSFLCESNLYH